MENVENKIVYKFPAKEGIVRFRRKNNDWGFMKDGEIIADDFYFCWEFTEGFGWYERVLPIEQERWFLKEELKKKLRDIFKIALLELKPSEITKDEVTQKMIKNNIKKATKDIKELEMKEVQKLVNNATKQAFEEAFNEEETDPIKPKRICGWVDKNGKVLAEGYAFCFPFDNGFARFLRNDKEKGYMGTEGFIDKNGKEYDKLPDGVKQKKKGEDKKKEPCYFLLDIK